MSSLTHLTDKKLLFVTGKGGIGKTLLTVALGQAAAAAGRRVLLVEAAADDHLAPVFGRGPVGHRETEVQPGLSIINLNPADTFREYIVKYVGQPALFETVFSHKMVKSFLTMISGFAETIMLGRLFYTSELAPGQRFDTVIFDGYASGHFLSLMTTPDAVMQSSLGGPLVRETERVRNFLADSSKVGIAYVAAPEELVVSEALDFLPQLAKRAPAKLDAVILNRMPLAPINPSAEGAAAQHAVHRLRQAEVATRILREGLAKFAQEGLTLPLWILPDLGYIPEPLAPDFGTLFAARAVKEDAP